MLYTNMWTSRVERAISCLCPLLYTVQNIVCITLCLYVLQTIMMIIFILHVEKWSYKDEVVILRCLQAVHLSLCLFLIGMLGDSLSHPLTVKWGGLVTSDGQQGMSRSDLCDHFCVVSHFSAGVFNCCYELLWCLKQKKCIYGHHILESLSPWIPE